MMKRILSLLLSVAMVLSMVPAQVFAEEWNEEEKIVLSPAETETVTLPAETAAAEEATASTEEKPTEPAVQETETQPALAASEGTMGDSMSWNLDDSGTVQIGNRLEAADAPLKEQVHYKSLHRIIVMMPKGQFI